MFNHDSNAEVPVKCHYLLIVPIYFQPPFQDLEEFNYWFIQILPILTNQMYCRSTNHIKGYIIHGFMLDEGKI